MANIIISKRKEKRKRRRKINEKPWLTVTKGIIQIFLHIHTGFVVVAALFNCYYLSASGVNCCELYFLSTTFISSFYFSFFRLFFVLLCFWIVKKVASEKKQQKTSNNFNELTHSTSQPNKQSFILLLFFLLENCMHILQSYSHGYIETHENNKKSPSQFYNILYVPCSQHFLVGIC